MSKQRTKRSLPESAHKALGWLLDIFISIYMAMILIVMPFYNKEGFLHIGTDKSTFFRAVSENAGKCIIPTLLLYLALGLYLRIRHGQLQSALRQIRLSVTDGFMLLYGIVVLISHACSNYQSTTWRGEAGWYMGTVTQLVLVAAYFLISRAWKRKNWLLIPVLPVSGAVFILGILNRFGIYPIDMRAQNVEFISTIGNINWYCGYMMSVFFGGVALLWQSRQMKNWQKYLLMLYVAAGFASLVTQGSSSGVFTLFIIFLVGFCLSPSDSRRMCAFWMIVLIFSLACLSIHIVQVQGWAELNYNEPTTELLTNSLFPIIMTIVSLIILTGVTYVENHGHYPANAFRALAGTVGAGSLFLLGMFVALLVINTRTGGSFTKNIMSLDRVMTFSPTWGSNRGATWTAGALCFLEQDILHKLVGVGPDGMASYLYTNGSSRVMTLVSETFGKNRLTNAHNEWLTILVNLGIFGFVAYAGTMITAIKRFLAQRGKNLVVTACGFCLLAYTVNNMFSFQQAMNVSTIFVLLGVGENYLRTSKEDKTLKNGQRRRK